MTQNVGKTDRLIRWLAGMIIIAIGLINNEWWGFLGLIPVATAVSGRCGLYYPLGINTNKKKIEFK